MAKWKISGPSGGWNYEVEAARVHFDSEDGLIQFFDADDQIVAMAVARETVMVQREVE